MVLTPKDAMKKAKEPLTEIEKVQLVDLENRIEGALSRQGCTGKVLVSYKDYVREGLIEGVIEKYQRAGWKVQRKAVNELGSDSWGFDTEYRVDYLVFTPKSKWMLRYNPFQLKCNEGDAE